MLTGDNPMRMPMVSLLAFEVIVFGLTIPGMIQVEGEPWQVALGTGGGGAVLAAAAAATLRHGIGYLLGWAAQVAIMAMGVLVPMMFFVGGVFALIWAMSFVLGRRLDAPRKP